MNSTDKTLARDDIAIVGMSVNVPGAEGVDAYWANLRDGVSALKRRDAAHLRAAGESAEIVGRVEPLPAIGETILVLVGCRRLVVDVHVELQSLLEIDYPGGKCRDRDLSLIHI